MSVKSIEQSGGTGAGALVLGVLVLGAVVSLVVFAVQALPDVHNPLDLRIGHYTDWKRATQAENARAIIKDPHSDCDFHNCQSSVGARLRVCKGKLDGVVTWAMQWVNEVGSEWREGTSFLQKSEKKRINYLRANGCDGL